MLAISLDSVRGKYRFTFDRAEAEQCNTKQIEGIKAMADDKHHQLDRSNKNVRNRPISQFTVKIS